jgi:hypothetical protein
MYDHPESNWKPICLPIYQGLGMKEFQVCGNVKENYNKNSNLLIKIIKFLSNMASTIVITKVCY